LVGTTKVYSGIGADIVMESITLIGLESGLNIVGVPRGWFVRSLVTAWIVLLAGTASVFLFPKSIAPTLGKPLWILSLFVVGAGVYGIIGVASLFGAPSSDQVWLTEG
jgi:hypothetical protein